MVKHKLDLTETKLFDIVKSSLKKSGQKINKKGFTMSKSTTKQNIMVVAKAALIAGFVSIAFYFGIPELSIEDVVALGSLSIAFALAIKFIK